MQNLKMPWIKLSVFSLAAALLMGCSTQSKSIEIQPTIRIPSLPSSVRYTEPKLPTIAKDSKDVAPVLQAYEEANTNNKFAIEQAQKHNKGLQRIYNKKKPKEKEVTDEKKSWTLFNF